MSRKAPTPMPPGTVRPPPPPALPRKMGPSFEMGPPASEGWKPRATWERWVKCPGEGCDYMAHEIWVQGQVTGVCTKCGECWHREPTP